MDCSLPGSSVHGVFQARIFEWGTISYSRGSSQPRDRICFHCVSCISRPILWLDLNPPSCLLFFVSSVPCLKSTVFSWISWLFYLFLAWNLLSSLELVDYFMLFIFLVDCEYVYICVHIWSSQVAQWKRISLEWRRRGFDLWVRKIPWRRAWQPPPVFLPGESHGEKPGGLKSIGLQRVGLDWSDWACTDTYVHTHTHTHTHMFLYIFFFRLSSLIDYYKILSIVVCPYWFYFIYGSMH